MELYLRMQLLILLFVCKQRIQIQVKFYVFSFNSKQYMSQTEPLRANFKQCISKLTQIDTRAQAFKEIQSLIMQNKTTNSLRIWLSVLSQSRKRHAESQIYVLDYIVKVYGKNLLDPIDKIPSLEKSVFRITEILSKFFGEQLQNVAIACQKTWLNLYEVTLKDQPLQIKKKLLYDNLEAIINGGGGKIAQTTAQFLVDGLLERSLALQDLTFFKQIAKRVLVLFLKTTVIHPSTLTCLQTILAFFNINNLIPLLQQIVAKILTYIPLAQPNSTGYRIRGQVCNSLAIIGQQIDRNGLQVYDRIVKVLSDMATDKVWAVQAPGRKALQIWNAKKRQWDEQFYAKNERIGEPIAFNQATQSPLENLKQNVSEYPKTADNWMINRNNNYQQHQDAELPAKSKKNQTSYDKVFYQNQSRKLSPAITKQASSTQNEQNFLHKNTGPGGGNNYHSAEQFYQRQKPEITHQKKIEEIKKSIYGAKSEIQFQDTVVLDEQKNTKKQVNQEKSRISQRTEENDETEDFLGQWEKVLQLAERDKFQESIKILLEMDDDLYFLRFFLKYSSRVLEKLTRPTSNKVLQKMLSIKKTNFMQQMLFKMVAESARLGVGKMLTNSQNLQISSYLQNASKISGLKQLSQRLQNKYENSLDQ